MKYVYNDELLINMIYDPIINCYGYGVQEFLRTIFEKCESPIENLFLSSIIFLAHEHGYKINVNNKLAPIKTGDTAPTLKIECQYKINSYRIDFLIELESENKNSAKILVECDGHDFHEKTKEQAAKDHKRDRCLQSLKYKIYRYTGSEVYKNTFACAMEVIEEVRKDFLDKN